MFPEEERPTREARKAVAQVPTSAGKYLRVGREGEGARVRRCAGVRMGRWRWEGQGRVRRAVQAGLWLVLMFGGGKDGHIEGWHIRSYRGVALDGHIEGGHCRHGVVLHGHNAARICPF